MQKPGRASSVASPPFFNSFSAFAAFSDGSGFHVLETVPVLPPGTLPPLRNVLLLPFPGFFFRARQPGALMLFSWASRFRSPKLFPSLFLFLRLCSVGYEHDHGVPPRQSQPFLLGRILIRWRRIMKRDKPPGDNTFGPESENTPAFDESPITPPQGGLYVRLAKPFPPCLRFRTLLSSGSLSIVWEHQLGSCEGNYRTTFSPPRSFLFAVGSSFFPRQNFAQLFPIIEQLIGPPSPL